MLPDQRVSGGAATSCACPRDTVARHRVPWWSLHGAFSAAREFEQESGFSVLANREDLSWSAAQGLGLGDLFRHWKSGHCAARRER
jgi:hypothetical protein